MASELLQAIKKADKIENLNKWFYWLIKINIFLQAAEFLVIMVFKNGAIGFNGFNIWMVVRRIISLLSYGFACLVLSFIYSWNSNGTIEALGISGGCHNDKVLDATFDQMQKYIQRVKGGFVKTMIFIFFTFVLLSFCALSFLWIKFLRKPVSDDGFNKMKDDKESDSDKEK